MLINKECLLSKKVTGSERVTAVLLLELTVVSAVGLSFSGSAARGSLA